MNLLDNSTVLHFTKLLAPIDNVSNAGKSILIVTSIEIPIN